MRVLCVVQVDEYSLKERFEMKYSWCRQTSRLLGVLHCMHMYVSYRRTSEWLCLCGLPGNIIVNSLSQVADHPMSSPCWVDRAGPVLAYRTMHSHDVSRSFVSETFFGLKDANWWQDNKKKDCRECKLSSKIDCNHCLLRFGSGGMPCTVRRVATAKTYLVRSIH